MRRHVVHEEHINHEAWAIPYGDLITLLLAFFVVMYSISSVNEGKYRTVANSIQNAFNGTPKIIDPIQVGKEPSLSLKPSVLSTPQKPTRKETDMPLAARRRRRTVAAVGGAVVVAHGVNRRRDRREDRRAVFEGDGYRQSLRHDAADRRRVIAAERPVTLISCGLHIC